LVSNLKTIAVRRIIVEKNLKKIEESSEPLEGVSVILCYWAGQLRQCRRQNSNIANQRSEVSEDMV